jgi:hypothetical protein
LELAPTNPLMLRSAGTAPLPARAVLGPIVDPWVLPPAVGAIGRAPRRLPRQQPGPIASAKKIAGKRRYGRNQSGTAAFGCGRLDALPRAHRRRTWAPRLARGLVLCRCARPMTAGTSCAICGHPRIAAVHSFDSRGSKSRAGPAPVASAGEAGDHWRRCVTFFRSGAL